MRARTRCGQPFRACAWCAREAPPRGQSSRANAARPRRPRQRQPRPGPRTRPLSQSQSQSQSQTQLRHLLLLFRRSPLPSWPLLFLFAGSVCSNPLVQKCASRATRDGESEVLPTLALTALPSPSQQPHADPTDRARASAKIKTPSTPWAIARARAEAGAAEGGEGKALARAHASRRTRDWARVSCPTRCFGSLISKRRGSSAWVGGGGGGGGSAQLGKRN